MIKTQYLSAMTAAALGMSITLGATKITFTNLLPNEWSSAEIIVKEDNKLISKEIVMAALNRMGSITLDVPAQSWVHIKAKKSKDLRSSSFENTAEGLVAIYGGHVEILPGEAHALSVRQRPGAEAKKGAAVAEEVKALANTVTEGASNTAKNISSKAKGLVK